MLPLALLLLGNISEIFDHQTTFIGNFFCSVIYIMVKEIDKNVKYCDKNDRIKQGLSG